MRFCWRSWLSPFFHRSGPCALADHEISRRHELARIISSAWATWGKKTEAKDLTETQKHGTIKHSTFNWKAKHSISGRSRPLADNWGGGGERSPKYFFWPFGPQFGLKIGGEKGRAPQVPTWILHWVYHVSAVEASCGDVHIMLLSSRFIIKTKWGYVPILGQFVDFNSFYCPHLPTFLTQMRKIFILSWPEFQKNVPATEDFRQFSEDFLTLTKMSGDFQTTFEHFRSYLMLFRRLSNWLLKRRKK